MFIDETRIHVQAGRGGNGCASMLREKYRPNGGPDGGTGGHGGDVVLVASRNQKTLLGLRGTTHYRAEPGRNGGPKNMTGRRGQALRVEVPLGTLVRRDDDGALLADLAEEGREVVVAEGGRGGRGNRSLVRPEEPLPFWAEKGEPGAERWIRLELKVMADVGLLGLPNAGKSTLLSVMSSAKPKIAAYPFTTLEPQLGAVGFGVERGGRGFVLADLPGLVQGAHQGAGLGDRFLRHLDRCRLLLHLVDVSGTEGRDPVESYRTIRRELSLWHDDLADKPEIVVGTKLDIPGAEEGLERLRKAVKGPVLGISAATQTGLGEMAERVLAVLAGLPEGPIQFPATPVIQLEREEGYRVVKIDKGFWQLEGGKVDRLIRRYDLENPDSAARLDHQLRLLGAYLRLASAGAQEGDTVRLGNFLFEYLPEDGVAEGGDAAGSEEPEGPACTAAEPASPPDRGDEG